LTIQINCLSFGSRNGNRTDVNAITAGNAAFEINEARRPA